MWKQLGGGIVLAGAIWHADAAELATASMDKIAAMLGKPAVLCGHFEQSKQLTGMKRPLASSGRFCVVAGKGVLWRTLQPFPNTMRLTRDEIINYQGDRVVLRLEAKQEPTVRMINSVLFSMLAGDLAELQSLFLMDGSIAAERWQVTLKARAPALAQAIGTIHLEGGHVVHSIRINEASGDSTAIEFSGVQTGESAMLADDKALF